MEWLKGKKSYIVAAAMGILGVLVSLGHLEASTANNILIYLAAALGATLRAGINKQGN